MQYNFLVCGHLDLTLEQFEKYYVPEIESVKSDSSFKDCEITWYIGGAEGTDTFAQDYLHSKGDKIVVCDKGEQNHLKHEGEHVNGFASYAERDAYMVDKCSGICVCLFDNVRSLGSGSFANVVSKSIGAEVSKEFMKYARSNTFETVEEYCDGFGMYSSKLQDIASKCLVIPTTNV